MISLSSGFVLPGIYLAASYPIFLKVYQTSTEIIDEEFHIKQAKEYCLGNYHVWNPKITTLPGLYLLTTVLLPLKFCTTFNLRLIILLASSLNVYLLRQILIIINGNNKKIIWNTLNISILPPMYFFAHLYYTDIISITSVLAMYYFWLRNKGKLAASFGFCSIMIRQTNVVWIIMFLGISCLNNLVRNFKNKSGLKSDKNNVLLRAMKWHLKNLNELFLVIYLTIKNFWPYISVIIGFLLFVFLNGSIVVGDKTAHVATIHLTQVFYFSAFTLLFGFCLIPKIKISIELIWKNKLVFIFLICLFLIIVKYNTLEHPYLLADNRHYTFYIWNRFYSKYSFFKYLMIPIYVLSLLLIFKSIQHNGFNFLLMFSLTTCLVLSLQNLLEIRYFLIPYLIIRLNIIINSRIILFIESIGFLLVNFLTFYIFFTKEIYWVNFENVQRLIW